MLEHGEILGREAMGGETRLNESEFVKTLFH